MPKRDSSQREKIVLNFLKDHLGDAACDTFLKEMEGKRDHDRKRSETKKSEKSADTKTRFSGEEIRMLKRAAKEFPSSLDKKERWASIAKAVGRSKRECYNCYKDLVKRARKKKERIKQDTEEEGERKEEVAPQKVKMMTVVRPRHSSAVSPRKPPADLMVLEDVEEDFSRDFATSVPALSPFSALPSYSGKKIDLDTLVSLRKLLFPAKEGSTLRPLSESWLQQGFSRNAAAPDLGYGIVQSSGGPCGVLASVQAMLMKELLFGEAKAADWKNPSQTIFNSALAKGLAEIIWRCGDGSRAIVALKSLPNSTLSTPWCRKDGITECLSLHELPSKEAVRQVLSRNLGMFLADLGSGVALTTYSCVLSRGVENCKKDMDVLLSQPAFVGAHNYATQELVNLLLIGRSHTNVFDGTERFEDSTGESEDCVVLRGIPSRADAGFLTLFEHYGQVQVGSHYKDPKFPIWVVCSESHYSILFSEREIPAELEFDLLYYDGLSRQTEEIRLTVRPGADLTDCELGKCTRDSCGCIVPPLDHVIRTKWRDSAVEWNGTDPIL